jgi:hypothetical protein
VIPGKAVKSTPTRLCKPAAVPGCPARAERQRGETGRARDRRLAREAQKLSCRLEMCQDRRDLHDPLGSILHRRLLSSIMTSFASLVQRGPERCACRSHRRMALA